MNNALIFLRNANQKKNPDCMRVQRDRFIFKLSKLYISKIDIWHTLFYSNIEIHVWQPNSKWWITKKKLLSKKKMAYLGRNKKCCWQNTKCIIFTRWIMILALVFSRDCKFQPNLQKRQCIIMFLFLPLTLTLWPWPIL